MPRSARHHIAQRGYRWTFWKLHYFRSTKISAERNGHTHCRLLPLGVSCSGPASTAAAFVNAAAPTAGTWDGKCELPGKVYDGPHRATCRRAYFDVQPAMWQYGLTTCAACQPASRCHPDQRPTTHYVPHCATACQRTTSVDFD